LAIWVSGENLHDMKGLEPLLAAQVIEPPAGAGKINLCLYAGYTSVDTALLCQRFGMVSHVRPRGEEKAEKQQGKTPRRWVVERTHGWMNRYRRLLIRWEKRNDTYLGFLHLACTVIVLTQLFPG
jgi:putative transposase